MVVLNDRREFQAEVVGADAAADLALLRIDPPSPLPALPLGSFGQPGSRRSRAGDRQSLRHRPDRHLGHHLGPVAHGTACRLRSLLHPDGCGDQSGNSGSALVTIDGQLVGVNTAIFTRSGGSIGIGFAIPIDLVKALVRSIEGGGSSLARPWLGAKVQTVTPELARQSRAGAAGRCSFERRASCWPCTPSRSRAGRCDHRGRRC